MSDEASPPPCPNCAKLEKRVAELEATVAELKAVLRSNSSNSSKPPSSDPPWQRPPLSKPPSGKRPGGQPGHSGSFRQRLPIERVKHILDYVPEVCGHCRASLRGQYGPHLPETSWHQVAELPEVLAEITEHRGHQRTCAYCGKTTRAEIPAEIRAHCTGPKLAATLSFMGGCLHASKRAIQETCDTLFGVPLSLGTLSKLEADTSAALQAPHAEALEAVRAAPVKNVDETGWARHGKLCWLWLAATARIAVFAIHAQRGKAGFKNLLGKVITGIVCSDRWSVYALVEVLKRQLCWAHLKRDFQKFKELGGEARKTGHAGLRAVKQIFAAWSEWKQRRIERKELQARLTPTCIALYRALQRGRDGPDKKVRRFCKRLLKDYEALWLFVDVEGVEPTNNHAERCLRPAVMWRKRSFGNHSEDGCRFTERLLTAVQTLRLQKRPVLEYLKSAVLNYRAGRPVPSLTAA
jgi:transposase